MIQQYLKELVEPVAPKLEWTFDFSTGKDNTGAVYHDDPVSDASPGDLPLYQPTYTIQIESSKHSEVEKWAWDVHDLLDKRRGDKIIHAGRVFNLIFIQATSPPTMIGIENRKLIYSFGVQVTLTRTL